MDQMWNERDIKQPPTFTCKLTSADISFTQLRKLSDVCWNAIGILQNNDLLVTEVATLSRLIFRMKRMFRGDKGFKCLQKILKCLRHFLSLNLASMYDNLFRTVPWEFADNEIYCPTLQMLEFVLLRTQGLAGLLCRTIHTCEEGAHFFRNRMSSGHNWQVSLLCLGVIGRIWAFSKHIMLSCVKWYSAMVPFTKVLKPVGPLLLPQNYAFPQDIQSWLAVPWINTQSSSSPCESASITEEETNFDEVSTSTSQTFSMDQSSHFSGNDDLGVSISRSSIEKCDSNLDNKDSQIILLKRCPAVSQRENEDMQFLNSQPIKKGRRTKRRNSKKLRIKTKTKVGLEEDKAVGSCEMNSREQQNLPQSEDIEETVSSENKSTLSKKVNPSKHLPILTSEEDVLSFLKRESKKRNVTASLDEKQWKLLKGLLGKFCVKLKKTLGEKKKAQIMDQIGKALNIALS